MDPNKKNNDLSNTNCREHLANENTFLAWIRTCIAIIAFGFVIERFSLFMKQMSFILGKGTIDSGLPSNSYSAVIGIFLVAFGTLMSVLGFLKYKKTQQQLEEGRYRISSWLDLILALFIFVVGVFLVVYLFKSVP